MHRLINFLFLVCVMLVGAPSERSVVSYKVWRAQKVKEAKVSLNRIQKESRAFSKAPPALKTRLRQSRTNVAIANELTPNDYFILYLGPKYKGNGRALEAAARFMSRQELSEILVGYSNFLGARDDSPRPTWPPALVRANAHQ